MQKASAGLLSEKAGVLHLALSNGLGKKMRSKMQEQVVFNTPERQHTLDQLRAASPMMRLLADKTYRAASPLKQSLFSPEKELTTKQKEERAKEAGEKRKLLPKYSADYLVENMQTLSAFMGVQKKQQERDEEAGCDYKRFMQTLYLDYNKKKEVAPKGPRHVGGAFSCGRLLGKKRLD